MKYQILKRGVSRLEEIPCAECDRPAFFINQSGYLRCIRCALASGWIIDRAVGQEREERSLSDAAWLRFGLAPPGTAEPSSLPQSAPAPAPSYLLDDDDDDGDDGDLPAGFWTGTWGDKRLTIMRILYQRSIHSLPMPSLRDLVSEGDLVSTSVVLHHMRALEAHGYIAREAGKARSIRILRLPPPNIWRKQ